MNAYVNRVINLAFRTTPPSRRETAHIRENYSPTNRAQLIETATQKKVLPVVGKLMLSLGLDTALWEQHYRHFANRNRQITQLMDQVFRTFDRAGIHRVCVFENYGAMLAADTDIALYSSGDVDLFADITQKEQIQTVLADFQYDPLPDENNRRGIATEFRKKDGLIRINVAWKPLIRHSLPLKADTSQYFHWESMGRYQNTAIRLPGPEVLLYLCFLRIAVHGYSRSPDIRLYIDTYNATCNDPDWEQVMDWARADGMTTKFVTVAAIAHDLIGIPVPEFVLEQVKNDPDSQKILAIAYDFEAHTLRYDPSGLQLIKLEAASDNCSVAGLLLRLLFPPSGWLTEYYLAPGEKPFRKYINYYKHLL